MKKIINIIIKVMYGITIICAFIGVQWLYVAIQNSKSSPQQAAGAAIGATFVIIPYCIARAMEKIFRKE